MKYLLLSMLLGWLLSGASLYAQDDHTHMNDLAYVIEDTTDRRQVFTVTEQFYVSTGAAISFLSLYEDSFYARYAEPNEVQWLRQQEYGISISVKVDPRNKAFLRCDIRTSPALTEWLPTHERQRIQRDIMEYYFSDQPSPSYAFSRGLIEGVKAIQAVIIKNKNRSEPWSLTEQVREALLVMQEESAEAEDSLVEAVSVRSEALESVIEKGYFYPPRIKGPNDEFIGDGMSQYAALIVRTADEKQQMEPIMLELDSVRNDLYRADYTLQRSRAVVAWIEQALPSEPLDELTERIAPLMEVVEDEPTARNAAIRTGLEQIIDTDLSEVE